MTAPSASPTPRPARQDLALVRDGDFWLSNLDGTGSLQLTHDGADGEPHWAPDGRRLLFLRGKGAEAELYSIGADGSGLRRLTDDRLEQPSPRWAPKGGLIAYVQPRDAAGAGVADPDRDTEIWMTLEDGSAARKLVVGFDPAWLPKGLRLAVVTFSGAFGNPAGRRGYLCSARMARCRAAPRPAASASRPGTRCASLAQRAIFSTR